MPYSPRQFFIGKFSNNLSLFNTYDTGTVDSALRCVGFQNKTTTNAYIQIHILIINTDFSLMVDLNIK